MPWQDKTVFAVAAKLDWIRPPQDHVAGILPVVAKDSTDFQKIQLSLVAIAYFRLSIVGNPERAAGPIFDRYLANQESSEYNFSINPDNHPCTYKLTQRRR